MACSSCKSSTCTGCKNSSISLPPAIVGGTPGTAGTSGSSAFVYIAYATSNTGANFATSPFTGATYLSTKSTTTAQTNDATLHAGNWMQVLEPGTNGGSGTNGTDGIGISTVIRTTGDGSPGTTDIYTITYTNATTSTFNVANGSNGAAGSDGSGSQILYGSTVPDAATGVDGDTYIDTSTKIVYTRAAGAWTLKVNLTGLTGNTGASGTNGIDGTNGLNASVTDGVAYGQMYELNGAPKTLTTSYEGWNTTTLGQNKDLTYTLGTGTTGSTFTATTNFTGVYQASIQVAMSVSAATSVYTVILKNGTPISSTEVVRTYSTQSTNGAFGITELIDLNVGDTIALAFKRTGTGTITMTPVNVSFDLVKVVGMGPQGATGTTGLTGAAGASASTNYAALLTNAGVTAAYTATPATLASWDDVKVDTYTGTASTGILIATATSDVFIDFNITASSGLANVTYTFEVYKNDTIATGIKSTMIFVADATESKTASIRYPFAVNAEDTYRIKATAVPSSDLEIKTASFTIKHV